MSTTRGLHENAHGRIETDSANQQTIKSWLDRGDSVGVFVNQDLSSHNPGDRLYMPITAANKATSKGTAAPSASN